MSIAIQNITKLFGDQLALDGITIEIPSDQITALIGPNGAGKSTLMKIICGYYLPSSGHVEVNGKIHTDQMMEIRKEIGYLPELNPLYYDLYVKEYLKMVGGIYGVNDLKDRIAEVIELTGLSQEQQKKIGVLSRGYKQRVGIAQAIIHDPKVLILDEPTTGLDPNQIVEIRNLIKTLSKNKTVLLSTHLMQEVEAISDQVIILNQGKIVEDNKVDKIKLTANHSHVVEVEFAEGYEVTIEILKGIEGVEEVKMVKPQLFLIETKEEKRVRERIFQLAVDHNTSILSLQLKEASLEEIFQRLTS